VVGAAATVVSVGSMVVAVGSSVELVVDATDELDDVEEAPLIDLSSLHAASARRATPTTSAQRRVAEVASVEVCMWVLLCEVPCRSATSTGAALQKLATGQQDCTVLPDSQLQALSPV